MNKKNTVSDNSLSQLQELDKAKTQFMMLINHELKTPLTNIINFTALLKVSKLNLEQEKYLAYIESSASILKKLIKESLDFIAAETGQLKLNKTIVSTPALLKKPLKKLQKKLKSKNQNLDLNIDSKKACLDVNIIQQILDHLLHNAVKFGPQDTAIQLSVTPLKDKNSLKFSISNMGKEIPKETIEKIFKPFVLNEHSMNHSQGFGLGLSLCQALLKVHGSKLSFSNDKKITTVSFCI